MRTITLAQSNKIIAGIFASAKRRKAYALAAIVLDAGGRLATTAINDRVGNVAIRITVEFEVLPATSGGNSMACSRSKTCSDSVCVRAPGTPKCTTLVVPSSVTNLIVVRPN